MNSEVLLKQSQKFFGIEYNQLVWSLLGKEARTEEESELMIHAAHASMIHWIQCGGTEVNRQRGEWLLSRVYSVLNIPERALHHAEHCAELTNTHSSVMEDFDKAYAMEAMARALACAGKSVRATECVLLATDMAQQIADDESRNIFQSDLDSAPWFGVR